MKVPTFARHLKGFSIIQTFASEMCTQIMKNSVHITDTVDNIKSIDSATVPVLYLFHLDLNMNRKN